MIRHVACSLGSWTFALTLASGCLLDERRCGENQVETEGQSGVQLRGIDGCICKPGFVPAADLQGCVACAENEVPLNGTCSCAPGFQRAAIGDECVPRSMGNTPAMLPMGEGKRCSSANDCAGTDATYCQKLIEPHICLSQGCLDDPSRCAATRVCCDFSSVPQLQAARGLCLLPTLCTTPGKVHRP